MPEITQPAPKEPKLVGYDYNAWDLLDYFEIWQIPSLWIGRDPSLSSKITPESYPVYVAIKQAVMGGKLKVYGLPFMPTEDEIPDDARISRESLIEYAQSKGQKPDFLFPKERIPF